MITESHRNPKRKSVSEGLEAALARKAPRKRRAEADLAHMRQALRTIRIQIAKRLSS